MSQKKISDFFAKRQRLSETSTESPDPAPSSPQQESNESPSVVVESAEVPPQRTILSNNFDIGIYVERPATDSNLILSLLTSPWTPGKDYAFPSTGTRNLRFQLKWFDKFPWLAYSDVLEGALCKFCVVFGTTASRGAENRQELGRLSRSCHNNWNNALERFKFHQETEHHKASVQKAENFTRIERTRESVMVQQNTYATAQIKENRARLIPVIESILFCGRQCIALRGHRDDGPLQVEEPIENDGNFRSLLRFRGSCDSAFKNNITKYANNATYFSKTIQNDLIECIGSFYQQQIVQKLNSSKCFSILADETTDVSGVEQMTICVRYIAEDGKLKEDFLCFVPLVSMNANTISDSITTELKRLNIDMKKLRGQGYDGASVMKGHLSGVNVKIKEQYPSALYVHCSSHALNLVLSHACSIGEIRNTMGTIGEIINFFNTPKRQNVLKNIIVDRAEATKRQKLISYCETRFIQRHDSLFRFIELYDFILLAFEVIEEDFDSKSSSKAQQFMAAMKRFGFIVGMFVAEDVLASTVWLSKQLQTIEFDLAACVDKVEDLELFFQNQRNESILEFSRIWKKIEDCANNNHTIIEIPRQSTRQNNRSNVPSSSPVEYYRRAFYIPFLDHVISELNQRFSAHKNLLKDFYKLIPRYSTSATSSVDSLLEFYDSDLDGTKPVVMAELRLWEQKWKSVELTKRPANAVSALAECDPLFYPNIHILLTILATLPVSTCSAERSFSTLRRLKNYLRNTTEETRLNGLALMCIHREILPYVEEIIDLFASKKSRRIDLIP